ncbi:MAG: 7,8-didemethyl-8-hydroxy-5-deazariboflavin synthase subunit CofG [Spirulina sp. SIO3F2]|nr:7,8-didemethyl-8-hydroxy-5-deazariboflavin synthase subunit CofG [Spirulina sp. SIO3F2]
MAIVTYSPAYTLVPTYECFNRCSYCNFRVEPGQDQPLDLDTARQRLQALPQDVCEILLLSGEVHPRSDQRTAWFERIYSLCQLALDLGFLPHTNAGILSCAEMTQLKQVNVSMGLMLEQLTPQWLKTVHRYAPSKVPALRLEQLQWAGELRIPFTTGLLLGLGETEADWCETLNVISQIQQCWGHIQEVILQPYCPGSQEIQQGLGCSEAQLLRCVAIARELLPETIALQIPPNLVRSTTLRACLNAGVTDLGGIGPTDEVNPNYPHATITQLQKAIAPDWQLVPRLPVYPQYIDWLSIPLQQAVVKVRSRQTSRTAAKPSRACLQLKPEV